MDELLPAVLGWVWFGLVGWMDGWMGELLPAVLGWGLVWSGRMDGWMSYCLPF